MATVAREAEVAFLSDSSSGGTEACSWGEHQQRSLNGPRFMNGSCSPLVVTAWGDTQVALVWGTECQEGLPEVTWWGSQKTWEHFLDPFFKPSGPCGGPVIQSKVLFCQPPRNGLSLEFVYNHKLQICPSGHNSTELSFCDSRVSYQGLPWWFSG